jgi:hypothetical protein
VVLAEVSNGLAVFWVGPVDWVEAEFEEISLLRVSMADDAAPRANNMAELQQRRTTRPLSSRRFLQQTPCQREKPNKTAVSCIPPGPH